MFASSRTFSAFGQYFILSAHVITKKNRPAKEADLSEFLKPPAKISENPIKIRFEFRKLVLISSVPPKRNPHAGHIGPSSPFECTRLLCTIVDFSK